MSTPTASFLGGSRIIAGGDRAEPRRSAPQSFENNVTAVRRDVEVGSDVGQLPLGAGLQVEEPEIFMLDLPSQEHKCPPSGQESQMSSKQLFFLRHAFIWDSWIRRLYRGVCRLFEAEQTAIWRSSQDSERKRGSNLKSLAQTAEVISFRDWCCQRAKCAEQSPRKFETEIRGRPPGWSKRFALRDGARRGPHPNRQRDGSEQYRCATNKSGRVSDGHDLPPGPVRRQPGDTTYFHGQFGHF